MDRKFGSDTLWFASPLCNLQSFKEEAVEGKKMLEELIMNAKEEELSDVLVEKTGCSEEAADQIYNDIAMKNLVNNPVDPAAVLEDFRGDKNDLCEEILQTHRYLKKRNDYIDSSRQRKSSYLTSLKYDKYRIGGAAASDLYRPQVRDDQKSEDDIVLILDVLVPYNRILTSTEMRSSRLICLSDTVVPLEDGKELETPDFENATSSVFPSSFMFINDTFYIDMTHPNATDISEPIRKFMDKREIFDEVEVVDIEGVKVSDLTLRLGQPYVYQHSGTCEHLLVFHDLRLMHANDPQGMDVYPVLIFEKSQEKKCEACHKTSAAFVVEKSELLPLPLMYFCDPCFRDFMFPNGIKTTAFRAWPYYEINKLRM